MTYKMAKAFQCLFVTLYFIIALHGLTKICNKTGKAEQMVSWHMKRQTYVLSAWILGHNKQ